MLRTISVLDRFGKPLTPRRAAEVCLMIAVGVQNLHDHGVCTEACIRVVSY